MRQLAAIIILLIALLIRLEGQENINPNGFNTIYYPNGKVLSEGYLKDGKPEGYWRTYYTTGVIKSEGNRKNFLLDSVWIFYSITSDTINKINYLYGKKNGYYYEYFDDHTRPESIGRIKSKELYVNDLKEGISYSFYEEGMIHESYEYFHDLLDGMNIEFEKDGRIITIKKYSKGFLVERQKINRYNEKEERTGEWIEFYKGTKIKSVSNYKDGLLDGYYKEYNELGNLTITILYDKGRIVDQVNEKDEEIVVLEKHDTKGTLIERGPYKNNVPVGIHKNYDEEGNITSSTIYDDFGTIKSRGLIDKEGNKQNEWKDFFEEGKLKDEGNYKNNLREGKWTFYFIDGKIQQVGSYKNGKEIGLWVRYYNSGKVYIEENFYNGKEDGLYTEYDSVGSIITTGEYLEGEKEGEWTIKINDFSAKGEFVTGLMDGRWKYYYDDGKVMFEGDYIQGNPEGKLKYYYEDGTLKEEQYYSSGIPDKLWKKYDLEGNVIVAITYKDGEEYRINGVRIEFPEDNKVLIK